MSLKEKAVVSAADEATVQAAAEETAQTPATTPCRHVATDSVGHGYTPCKVEYAKRLRRIEGQVRGIARMVDEDVYCIDILTQVAAATKALQAVAMGLVNDHMSHCVIAAARGTDEDAQEKVAEVSAAIARLLK